MSGNERAAVAAEERPMSRMGAQKRRKELARQEKRRAKEAARAQRKLDKQPTTAEAEGPTADPAKLEPAAPAAADL